MNRTEADSVKRQNVKKQKKKTTWPETRGENEISNAFKRTRTHNYPPDDLSKNSDRSWGERDADGRCSTEKKEDPALEGEAM